MRGGVAGPLRPGRNGTACPPLLRIERMIKARTLPLFENKKKGNFVRYYVTIYVLLSDYPKILIFREKTFFLRKQ